MNLIRSLSIFFGTLAVLAVTGCKTAAPPPLSPEMRAETMAKYNTITLREGDVLNISFPGAPTLDKICQIRRDGKISLAQVGEVTAAGRTPAELEKDLLKLYEPELVVKQVSVSLGSSAYPIFVIGAVLRPGKVMVDRPVSAFEAVMEAGGFDFTKANTKEVTVLREDSEGKVMTFKLNMKAILEGKPATPFYMKPSDVIFVREKISWF